MSSWALVTPSSRGIGLELARRLLRTTPIPIVATARGSTDQAKEAILGKRDGGSDMDSEGDESRLSVLRLDVTDEDSIASAASQCQSMFPTSASGEQKNPFFLRTAFIVPGILYPEKSPAQLDLASIQTSFATNTIGPLLLLKHFSQFLPTKSTTISPDPSLPSQAVWATMSARVGSITDNKLGGWYSYRSSKAAVNQITKTFDNFLRGKAGDKAVAVSLHPGTVKTGLSKEFWDSVKDEKLFTPEFSAERLVEVVKGLGGEQRGKCWDWEGKEVPP